jgi:RNA polymerase sigma factor (sigma-70 family)
VRKDDKWTHKTEIQKIQQKISKVIPDFPKDSREDKALIKAYKNGSEEAGKALIENYLDIISIIYNKPCNPPRMKKPNGQRFITKPPTPNAYDKEDILHEILYQFFTLVHEYDESYNLPFYALVKGKLFFRFHNHYYREYFEIKNKECEYSDEVEAFIGATKDEFPEDKPEKSPSQYIELYDALDKLSKRQREVVEMSIVRGWDSTMIAEELNMSDSTARVHLKRGLEKLKKLMGAD